MLLLLLLRLLQQRPLFKALPRPRPQFVLQSLTVVLLSLTVLLLLLEFYQTALRVPTAMVFRQVSLLELLWGLF